MIAPFLDNDHAIRINVCPTCSLCLSFFTVHSPSDCIVALKARVAQLEEAERREAGWRVKLFSDILKVNAPKNPPTPAQIEEIAESLQMAHNKGGFD